MQLLDEIDLTESIDNTYLHQDANDSSQFATKNSRESIVSPPHHFPCYYYPYDKDETIINQYIKSLTCKTIPTDPIKGGALVYIAIHHTVHYFRSACLSIFEKKNELGELEKGPIELKWGDHNKLMKIVRDSSSGTLKVFLNYLLFQDMLHSCHSLERSGLESNQKWLSFIKDGVLAVNERLQTSSSGSYIDWTKPLNKSLIEIMLSIDDTVKSDRVKSHLSVK